MPIILNPEEERDRQDGDGWSILTLADHRTLGGRAMVARRWSLEPLAASPEIDHGDTDEMLYVIRGSGAAVVGGERLPLQFESVLWLEPGDRYRLEAGPDGLEILQGYAPGDQDR